MKIVLRTAKVNDCHPFDTLAFHSVVEHRNFGCEE